MPHLDQVVTSPKSQKVIDAKKTLNQFVEKINKRLERHFDFQLKNIFGVSQKEKRLAHNILKHIKEHNLRPAKRLRGSFIFYSYKMLGGKDTASALDAAMSIELIHTALLMHDDFMDQDNTRRGLPTTHEHYKLEHKKKRYRGNSLHYGESMAINAGDIALLSGYEILSKSKFDSNKKIHALNQQLRGIIHTGFGQAYDITLEAAGKATEQDIFDLHLAKTAIYTYENPLHIGATLAGASKSDLSLISQYAIPGGVAFQLQDDILGLYGDTRKTGKPAHSDLRQGKMTLLMVRAFETGSPTQVKRLKQIWGKDDLSQSEAQEARQIVKDCGSLGYSKKISIQWAQKAQKAIPKMKAKGWDPHAINYLDGIAQYMIEREM